MLNLKSISQMLNLNFKILNSKFEILNEILNSNVPNSKRLGFGIWDLEFCLGFRISDLEFLVLNSLINNEYL